MEETKKKTGFKNFQVFKRDEYDKSLSGTILGGLFMSAIGGVIVGFLAATYYVWIPILIRNNSSYFSQIAMNDHSFGLRFVVGGIAGFVATMGGVIYLYCKYMRK